MFEITDEHIDRIALAIYETHWKDGNPTWDAASDNVRKWVRDQARNAFDAAIKILSDAP